MKHYYVSDEIKGVFFTKLEDLKEYYRKNTYKERKTFGKIRVISDTDKLEMYVIKHRTHKNHIWSEL